jgi:arsenite methyltransferase
MIENQDSNLNTGIADQVGVLDELPLWSAPFGLQLLERVKLRKHITALDIGFGTGFPLIELAMRLGQTCTVYGIDPWEAAIRRTEEKIARYGIGNITIIHGVAEEIPLTDNSVDLIVSNNGINNVHDLKKVISECYRILNRGGQFLLSVNLDSTMIEFYSVLEQVLTARSMKDELTKMKQHIYSKRRPLNELTGLLKEAGFMVENLVEDQFAYHYTDGTTMLQHHFIRLAFLPSWKEIVPADRQQEVFGKIEFILNEQSRENGLSLSVPFVVIDCRKPG